MIVCWRCLCIIRGSLRSLKFVGTCNRLDSYMCLACEWASHHRINGGSRESGPLHGNVREGPEQVRRWLDIDHLVGDKFQ
ncbi:hypothetical protein J1N35_024835 [Gossypium stocksii]|uniref:Uncharacterized protein n=1 Tax=Gossypium stocksii TaxID=47602 RepID=A0A9D3V540_9ROSI|nr:hypothetical protein J1N35_024835 [Gossypium stocksii]